MKRLPNYERLEAIVAETLELSGGALPRAVRQRHELTRDELSTLIGCSASAVEKWERDERPLSQPVATLLRIMLVIPEHARALLMLFNERRD